MEAYSHPCRCPDRFCLRSCTSSHHGIQLCWLPLSPPPPPLTGGDFVHPISTISRTSIWRAQHWLPLLAKHQPWSIDVRIIASEQGRNILFLRNLNVRAGGEPVITDFLSRHLYLLHQGPHPNRGQVADISVRKKLHVFIQTQTVAVNVSFRHVGG